MDSNNNSSVVRIICWSVVALILVSVLVYGLNANSLNYSWNNLFNLNLSGINIFNGSDVYGGDNFNNAYNDGGNYAVPIDGIDNIKLDWVNGSVKIKTYSGSEIKFAESANLTINQSEALRYGVVGNTLKIQCYSNGFRILSPGLTKNLELLIPQSIADSLDSISVDVVSATATISDVSPGAYSVDTTSGSATIENMNARSINIDTVSGAVNINNVDVNKLSIGTVSGAVKGKEVTASDLTISSISGSVDFEGAYQAIDVETTSGRVEFNCEVCPSQFDVETISGAVVLKIPDNDGFTVYYESLSGSLNSDFPMSIKNSKSIYGNGSANFDVDTLSGSFAIRMR